VWLGWLHLRSCWLSLLALLSSFSVFFLFFFLFLLVWWLFPWLR